MTSIPDISIIVAAFNAEETIEQCILSLVNQTTPNPEVIVVDDGSTDATARIVDEISERSPLNLVCVRQENQGRAGARNTGLALAQGEYLGFVDADDHAGPSMFEKLLATARATDADMVVCEYVSFDACSGAVRHHYSEGDSRLYGTSVSRNPDLFLQIGASICNKLVRSSLFGDAKINFPPGRDFEDLATTYRLAQEARRIEKVDQVLYFYRQGHEGSVMSSCDERYLEIPLALDAVNDHARANGLFDKLYEQLELVNFIHLISGRYDDLFACGTPEVRRRFIFQAFRHMDANFKGWRRDPIVRDSMRFAKRTVSTSMPLLMAYTDMRGVFQA